MLGSETRYVCHSVPDTERGLGARRALIFLFMVSRSDRRCLET